MEEKKPDFPPEYQELSIFLSEFHNESDRGAALVAASLLDEQLRDVLFAFFADVPTSKELLEGMNAPLGTFSSRLSAAYSLGLIQENEYREINIIRKIRNEFGHKWRGVDFKNQKIHDLCMQLPWLGPDDCTEAEKKDPRLRFNFEVAFIAFDLIWRSVLVKREKRQLKIWSNKMRS